MNLKNITSSFLFKNMCIIVVLYAAIFSTNAKADQNQIGLSLGGGGWGGGGSIFFDHGGVFHPSWSLGGELSGGGRGFLLGSLRAFYWQNPAQFSGFYGGPKAYIWLGYYTGFGIGAEGGWNYKFSSAPFALGASLDIIPFGYFLTALKINGSYSF